MHSHHFYRLHVLRHIDIPFGLISLFIRDECNKVPEAVLSALLIAFTTSSIFASAASSSLNPEKMLNILKTSVTRS